MTELKLHSEDDLLHQPLHEDAALNVASDDLRLRPWVEGASLIMALDKPVILYFVRGHKRGQKGADFLDFYGVLPEPGRLGTQVRKLLTTGTAGPLSLVKLILQPGHAVFFAGCVPHVGVTQHAKRLFLHAYRYSATFKMNNVWQLYWHGRDAGIDYVKLAEYWQENVPPPDHEDDDSSDAKVEK